MVPDQPGVQLMEDVGIKHTLYGVLRYCNQKIGTINLHSEQENFFCSTSTALFKAITDQIAVAVANILANEEILEREREKSVLLSITEDISTIRSKDDLFRVIMEKIKPIFGFDDAVVFISDFEQDCYYLLLSSTPQNRLENKFYEPLAARTLSLKDSIEEWIISHDKPFIYSTEEFTERFRNAPGVQLMQEVGIKDGMFGVMKNGGKTIGSFHVHSEGENFFRPKQLKVFQSVTEQLAVAVANILANEEILEREREKALLLSLSEDMATIRDRRDLWRVMMEKVKPLVDFDDAVVAVYSKDKKTANHILTMSPPERRTNRHYNEIVENEILISGSPIEYLINRAGNFIISTAEFAALFPSHPGILLMRETNLEYTLHHKLVWGGEIIGQFHLHFEKREQIKDDKLDLYKAIADQIAVAVANIRANEEIIEREREKSVLLSISEDIANVRDKETLLLLIGQRIQPLFCFDDWGLFVLEKDGEHHYDFCIRHPQLSPHQVNEQIAAQFGHRFAHRGSAVEYVMSSDTARLWNWRELSDQGWRHPALPLMVESGLIYAMIAPLKQAGEKIGVLIVQSSSEKQFGEKQLPLFQSVADQIAVAVANILANEEILRFADERRRRVEELAKANEAMRRGVERVANSPNALNAEALLEAFLLEAMQAAGATGGAISRWENGYYADNVCVAQNGVIVPYEEWSSEPIFVEAPEVMRRSDIDFATQLTSQDIAVAKVEETENWWKAAAEYHRRHGCCEVWNVPLVLRGEIIASLGLAFRESRAIDDTIRATLTALAQQATLALEMTRLSDEAKQAAVALEREKAAQELVAELARANNALQNTVAELTSSRDLNSFVGEVLRTLSKELDSPLVELWRTISADTVEVETWVHGGKTYRREDGDEHPGAGRIRVPSDLAEFDDWTQREKIFVLEEPIPAFSLATGEIICPTEWYAARGVRRHFNFPLQAGAQTVGSICVWLPEHQQITEGNMRLAQTLSHQTALAIQLTKLADEARREAEASAMLTERNRIAREIHDTLSQSFTGIIVQLEAGKRILADSLEEAEGHFERASSLSRQGLAQARRSVQALRLLPHDQIDLPKSLEQFVDCMTTGTPVKCDFSLTGVPDAELAPEINANFLRIAQEAVTNALRHAGADIIKVALSYEKNRMQLRVKDNGSGFDTESEPKGFGLIGMRERARGINAQLEIKSQPGGSSGGTEILVTFDKKPLVAM